MTILAVSITIACALVTTFFGVMAIMNAVRISTHKHAHPAHHIRDKHGSVA